MTAGESSGVELAMLAILQPFFIHPYMCAVASSPTSGLFLLEVRMHVDRQAGDELKTGRLWSNPKMAMTHKVQSPPSLVYHAPKCYTRPWIEWNIQRESSSELGQLVALHSNPALWVWSAEMIMSVLMLWVNSILPWAFHIRQARLKMLNWNVVAFQI
jgi:hypothetical protein